MPLLPSLGPTSSLMIVVDMPSVRPRRVKMRRIGTSLQTFAKALAASCALTASFVHAQETRSAEGDPAFVVWLDELRREALEQGISEATIDLAFSEVTPPVRRIIENDRNQPEVVQSYADYLDARVSEWRIDKGREQLTKHRELLETVAREYGIEARFLVAIWGMESNYGTYPIREPLFNVLATLAYDDRRAALFRAQFLAALRMLESGFPPYDYLKSSWAGAMGQAQFSAESYLQYAVDHDGDGKRDIWNSEADVIASIANYLKARGWRDDETWGRPVLLPPGDERALAAARAEGLPPDRRCSSYQSLGAWRDLQAWQALGVRREDGSDLPGRSIPAALVLGDDADGKAWLVYRNFCSIMSYNASFKYALSIGLLSDELNLQ